MHVNHRGARFGGFDCGIGNLSWCYRHQVAAAGGVARAGNGTGDDDIVIHFVFPSIYCLFIDL
jgi:hypothetical protein